MKRTEEISGTYLQGYILTTRRKLTEVFGEPTRYIESKTTIQWGVVFEGGVIATIYDYKREKGAPGMDEEITYNIGGLSPKAVLKVKDAMREKVGA